MLLGRRVTRGKDDDAVLDVPTRVARALDYAEAGSGHQELRRVSHLARRKVKLGREAINTVARRRTVAQDSGELRPPGIESRLAGARARSSVGGHSRGVPQLQALGMKSDGAPARRVELVLALFLSDWLFAPVAPVAGSEAAPHLRRPFARQ